MAWTVCVAFGPSRSKSLPCFHISASFPAPAPVWSTNRYTSFSSFLNRRFYCIHRIAFRACASLRVAFDKFFAPASSAGVSSSPCTDPKRLLIPQDVLVNSNSHSIAICWEHQSFQPHDQFQRSQGHTRDAINNSIYTIQASIYHL
jgi:hypothetical protein